LQKQGVDRHSRAHQKKRPERNPRLPWGHYPYSYLPPHYSKGVLNDLLTGVLDKGLGALRNVASPVPAGQLMLVAWPILKIRAKFSQHQGEDLCGI
jgi:hypothetical protein